ncbi:hypothetical protein GGTG_13620, partial [Gaeumannomyces tritici R3-111a-1]
MAALAPIRQQITLYSAGPPLVSTASRLRLPFTPRKPWATRMLLACCAASSTRIPDICEHSRETTTTRCQKSRHALEPPPVTRPAAMALVNYDSDSDSEGEAAPAPPQPASSAKPPTAAPKLVDRANPRKIIVNLPSASASSDEPPAKRARTEGGGGGRFGAFRSALPPPKNTVAPVAASRSSQPSGSSSSSYSSAQPLPFSFFKTSAEAAFSREPPPSAGGDGDEVDEFGNANTGLAPDRLAAGGGMRMKLPAPKSQGPQQQGPSIPEGQKPESEVKLVGKPLMFRPLSVARKPAKKSGAKAAASSAPRAMTRPAGSSSADAVTTAAPPAEAPKKKKVSLFSLGADEVDEAPQAEEPPAAEGGYQPLFEDVVTDPTTGEAVYSDYASYQAPGGGGGGGGGDA